MTIGIAYKTNGPKLVPKPSNFGSHYNEPDKASPNNQEYRVVFTATEKFKDRLLEIVKEDERLLLVKLGKIRKGVGYSIIIILKK